MSPNKKLATIPVPTIRRLPLYHHYLSDRKKKGYESVSCTDISEHMNLASIQVRKDLAYTGIKGRPKTGYVVNELIDALEKFLGWRNLDDAILVGCGNLGASLLGYEGFKKYGFNIVLGFDNDRNKIGKQIHNIDIYPIELLPKIIEKMHIKIGIITVNAENAQEVAELMISGGIKAIWNFAPAALNLPEDIILQQHDMAAALAVLSKKLEGLLKNSD